MPLHSTSASYSSESRAEQGRMRKVAKHAGTFNRLAVLETRANLRNTWVWRLYLPVIFFSYGLLLGQFTTFAKVITDSQIAKPYGMNRTGILLVGMGLMASKLQHK